MWALNPIPPVANPCSNQRVALVCALGAAMRRRDFIAVFAASTAWPLAARASQRANGMPHVGIIDNGPMWDPFRQELSALNYVEGTNITIVYRSTDGIPDQLFVAARALVEIPVDVIAVYGTPAAQAAQ